MKITKIREYILTVFYLQNLYSEELFQMFIANVLFLQVLTDMSLHKNVFTNFDEMGSIRLPFAIATVKQN